MFWKQVWKDPWSSSLTTRLMSTVPTRLWASWGQELCLQASVAPDTVPNTQRVGPRYLLGWKGEELREGKERKKEVSWKERSGKKKKKRKPKTCWESPSQLILRCIDLFSLSLPLFFFLPALWGIWDLSSLIQDQTHTSCNGSPEF